MTFPDNPNFEADCYFWVWMFMASCVGLFIGTYI